MLQIADKSCYRAEANKDTYSKPAVTTFLCSQGGFMSRDGPPPSVPLSEQFSRITGMTTRRNGRNQAF